MKIETLAKYNTLPAARRCQAEALIACGIIMGCDGLYWVVTLKWLDRLQRAGYEAVTW
jgi:hypothetical protein